MLNELGELRADIAVAALVDYRGQSRYETEIMQFQPLPLLLQAFTAHFAESGHTLPRPAIRGKGPAVIAVYSASGGTGKSTLALQSAQQAGISGIPAFYLNLEQWNASLPPERTRRRRRFLQAPVHAPIGTLIRAHPP